MITDIDRNVALVIFRFFPSPTQPITEEAKSTGITDTVLEISKKLENADLSIEKYANRVMKGIREDVAAQNNDEDSVARYWCDDVLSLICYDGKVWIELGRILDVEEVMIKETTQQVYSNLQEPHLRIVYFFVDVFYKYRPHRFFIDLTELGDDE